MKPKFILKIIVDALMSFAMLFEMGYHLWGEIPHEWVDAGLFALFILHHILNFDFYKSLFKSKFSARKILRIVVDLAALAAMIGLMIRRLRSSRRIPISARDYRYIIREARRCRTMLRLGLNKTRYPRIKEELCGTQN